MSNKTSSYVTGLRCGVPVVLGFIPVGIAYAVMARQAGFSITEIIVMSVSVFAGASQMMAVGMYAQGATVIAIIVATFIINLRHIIMSTCVMNRMDKTKTSLRLLSSFGVTDESFAIFTTGKKGNNSVYFFLGLITVTYSSWIIGSTIGAIASDFLPSILTASLGIALYAMFLALLIPSLHNNIKLALLVLLTAVCNSILSQFIDSSWSLIISTLVCAAAGVFFVDLEEENGGSNET